MRTTEQIKKEIEDLDRTRTPALVDEYRHLICNLTTKQDTILYLTIKYENLKAILQDREEIIKEIDKWALKNKELGLKGYCQDGKYKGTYQDDYKLSELKQSLIGKEKK